MDNNVEGTPIGNLGEPRRPIVERIIKEHQVTVEPRSIVDWRAGRSKPSVTTDRARASRLLKADSALYKDCAYLVIARAGVRQRRVKSGSPPDSPEQIFSSNNFVEDMARDVKLDPKLVRRAIRAMRVEIVYGQRQLTEGHNQIFIRLGETYLQHHLNTSAQVHPEKYKSLENSWNRTIPHFYKLLYGEGGGRFLGGWTPYEVAFLSFFYQDRIAKGSTLSPLDILVLHSYREGKNLTNLVKEVRGQSGIAVDRFPLTEHRNFLIYGKPHNPDFKHG